MDPSSVITQVTPDNNDASHLFTVQKGNGVQQKGKIVHSNSHMCLYNGIKAYDGGFYDVLISSC